MATARLKLEFCPGDLVTFVTSFYLRRLSLGEKNNTHVSELTLGDHVGIVIGTRLDRLGPDTDTLVFVDWHLGWVIGDLLKHVR